MSVRRASHALLRLHSAARPAPLERWRGPGMQRAALMRAPSHRPSGRAGCCCRCCYRSRAARRAPAAAAAVGSLLTLSNSPSGDGGSSSSSTKRLRTRATIARERVVRGEVEGRGRRRRVSSERAMRWAAGVCKGSQECAPLASEASSGSSIELKKLAQRVDNLNVVVVQVVPQVVGDPPLDHCAPRDEHSGQPAKG